MLVGDNYADQSVWTESWGLAQHPLLRAREVLLGFLPSLSTSEPKLRVPDLLLRLLMRVQ